MFIGKGSISAGNILNATMRLIMNETAYMQHFGTNLTSVTVTLNGAFGVPAVTDQYGIPEAIAIALAQASAIYYPQIPRLLGIWIGNKTVEYDQGGSYAVTMSLNGLQFDGTIFSVQMTSQDATVTTRTNSLVICLTWAILAFAVLDLRVDNYRHKPEKKK
jgi:hypothetical protein